jgi:uracil-DNA glycosylase family protein
MTQLDLFGEPAPENSAQARREAAEPTQLAPPGPEATPEEKEAALVEVRDLALVCTRCKLAADRTQVVFGEGSAAAPLMFIGEGPGETEDATGRPFVGRAGKLLEEVLRENGMAREHVYITNIVKCRPVIFDAGRPRNRVPEADEVAACQNWLRSQVNIIRPLVIVCLGAPAANLVIHKNFRIMQERGRWFQTSSFARWTMATLHPAFVLRQHGDALEETRRFLVGDIAAARQKVIEARRAGQSGAPATATLF